MRQILLGLIAMNAESSSNWSVIRIPWLQYMHRFCYIVRNVLFSLGTNTTNNDNMIPRTQGFIIPRIAIKND